jgi:hypothetical protein
MRRGGLLGLVLLVSAPVAHGQAAPPSGPLDLQLSAANSRYAIYFQRPSIKWTGRQAEVWIFMALPASASSPGGWYLQKVDCASRTMGASGIYPVTSSGVVRSEIASTAKPMGPITAGSMDESVSQILCDGKTFNFDRPAVTDVPAASVQARELLASLAKPS